MDEWRTKLQHLFSITTSTCDGSSHFPLPKELRNLMEGLINIKNEDNECFRWSLARYFNPVNKNWAKVRNIDRVFAKQLNSKGTKYFVHKKEYVRVKKQYNVSISVFGYEDKIPYKIYISKQAFEKHADLLLLFNSKNFHNQQFWYNHD